MPIYAPGKALRGGIPICFPWFGAHPEHKDYPAHGFARTREFSYRGARRAAEGGSQLEFLLEDDAANAALFPIRLQRAAASDLRQDARASSCP